MGLFDSDIIKERLFITVLDYDLSSAPDLLGIYVRSKEVGVTLQELNSHTLGTRQQHISNTKEAGVRLQELNSLY